MRLWTIHPRYLDTKGLLAVWREGLLAQQVLRNKTKGYRNHPQLSRFKSSSDPTGSISRYLRVICQEGVKRGYKFNEEKIASSDFTGWIDCKRGQLLYEWDHLKVKVQLRDARWYREIEVIEQPEVHTLFRIVEGEIEDWEVIAGRI